MTAYYNEIEAYPAQWLRNLSDAGHIAQGFIDERDIRQVQAQDLEGYTQAHFFAGIGVWSHALRLAGWSDSAPVWTGSCPCQPFSSAGRGKGFADDRHLWPAWLKLIKKCRPVAVFGEQVASPDGRMWFDVVQADLEALGFTVGAADLCAAGVGAPHQRQRLFFGAIQLGRYSAHVVENIDRERRERVRLQLQKRRQEQDLSEAAGTGEALGLANATEKRRQGISRSGVSQTERTSKCGPTLDLANAQGRRLGSGRGSETPRGGSQEPDRRGPSGDLANAPSRQRGNRLPKESARSQKSDRGRSSTRELGHAGGPGLEGRASQRGHDATQRPTPERASGAAGSLGHADSFGDFGRLSQGLPRAPAEVEGPGFEAWCLPDSVIPAGATRGFWSEAVWIYCRDGKARPAQRRAFPLAHGTPTRVGRVRAAGNAITAQAAAVFIQAFVEAVNEL